MTQKIQTYFKYAILAGLLYMPVFGFLTILPIRIWDESRLAINAYEMFNNGNFIVTFFKGNPDMWNTKPPLLIWFQVFFMKLLGVGELAVRMPSALAAFFTCVVLLIFSQKYLKSFWFGFIAILVLITTHGYINLHATRTGDYDALLTLFTTLSALLFFAFTETKKDKHLYLFFLFTALAVLTKSITGLLFLPGIFIYGLIQKQIIPLLKNKHFYIGVCSLLILVLGYYFLREFYNEGYIEAVKNNELGGRYLTVIEKQEHQFLFYFYNFMDFQITPWFLLIPCGIVTGLVMKNKKMNRITLFSFLMISTFFFVISSAQTKLEWYDVPMYPFLAILIAVFVYYIFCLLKDFDWFNQTLKVNIAPFVFLFLLGFAPYQKIFNKTHLPTEYRWKVDFYEISYFLQEAIKGKHDVNNQYLLYDGYKAHNLFYVNILNDKGVKFSFKDWKKLADKDIVIAHQGNIKKYIKENYKQEIIHTTGNIVTYKIYGKKD